MGYESQEEYYHFEGAMEQSVPQEPPMTDSLYKGTGGHNYIQEEDMEKSFIKQQQEEAVATDLLVFDYTSGSFLLDPVKLNTLTAQIIKNTCEEIKRQYFSHTNTDKKLIEVIEDIINNITKV